MNHLKVYRPKSKSCLVQTHRALACVITDILHVTILNCLQKLKDIFYLIRESEKLIVLCVIFLYLLFSIFLCIC